MRLDDFDPNAVDVDDQRGQSRGGGGFPLPIGGGKLGLGTIVLILIAVFVFKADPSQLLGQMQGDVGGPLPGQQAQVQGGTTVAESCTTDALSRDTCNALSSLNKTWEPIFRASNVAFQRPTLHFYAQSGQSGCGAAQSAMGPFYCPSDNGIYIDTDFYRQMEQELGAAGQFARLYVVAHEYGHHIQNLTGTSDQVRSLQSRDRANANRYSVRLELQADCYAGLWAAKNRDRLEAGDMESGLKAAHQIGDDTLMKNAGQRPVEDAFTHGSSAQRMAWLKKGLESGDVNACDTFADLKR